MFCVRRACSRDSAWLRIVLYDESPQSVTPRVEPDVKVKAEDALETATKLAERKLRKSQAVSNDFVSGARFQSGSDSH